MTESDEMGTGDIVEGLLANCLQHAQSEWESVVDQLCADSPEHAEEVRNRVAALERCGLLSKDGLARTQQGSETPLSLSNSNERLGRYRILKELGRGGQAVVYLAEDARLNRRVALKVLSGASEISDRALERFRREAHAVSRLDHPGICAVYEADTIDGTPTIAMRHIDGKSLRDDIASQYTTLDPSLQTSEDDEFIDFDEEPATASESTDSTATSQASRDDIVRYIEIVEKIARALHAAHEGGLVHRDIKPGNIMLTSDDEPVILDFGLAQDENDTDVTLTQTGDLLGTPAYMSPEQLLVQRIPIDRRTDIYSLGIVLFETITAKRPFDAPTRVQLYERILSSEPPDIRKLNSRTPTDLKVVVEVALQKNRDNRFQTALDFAEELRRIRKQEPILSRRTPAAARLFRWCQRHPTRALAAALLMIIASLGAYSLGKGREASLERDNREFSEREQARIRAEHTALELQNRGREFIDGLIVSHTNFGSFGDEDTIRSSVEGILDLFRNYDLPIETERPLDELATAISAAKQDDPVAGQYLQGAIYNLYSTMMRLGLDYAAQVDTPAQPKWATDEQITGWRTARDTYPEYITLLNRNARLIELIDQDPWRREMWRLCLRKRQTHNREFGEWAKKKETKNRPTKDILLLVNFLMSSDDVGSSGDTMNDAVKLLDHAIANVGHQQVDLLTAHLTRGMIQMGMISFGLLDTGPGKLTKTIRDFEICHALQPQSGLLASFLAKIQLLNGDIESAELTHQSSLTLAKTSDRTMFVKLIWGDALLRVGRSEEAATIFEELLASKPTADWYRIVGVTRLSLGESKKAIEFMELGLKLEPNNAQLITDYAQALLKSGDLHAGRAAALKALSINSRNISAWGYLAELNTRLNKHTEAVEAWSQLLAIVSAYGNVWVAKALAQLSADDPAGAIETLTKAESQFADDAMTLTQIAKVLQDDNLVKNKGRAIELLKQAVEIQDAPHSCQMELLFALTEDNQYEEAIVYSRAFLGFPALHDSSFQVSGTYAVESDPKKRSLSTIAYGVALSGSEQSEAALDAFRTSVELDPDSANGWNRLSIEHLELRQFNKAVHAAERAVSLQARQARHHKTLARALFDSGDLDAAEASFRTAIQLAPGITPEGSPSLIDLLWAQGKKQDSLDLAQSRFNSSKTPRAGGALMNAQLQAYDFELALATSKVALQLHPKSQQLAENQGWVLLQMGRTHDALESFTLSQTLNPKSEDTLRGMALAQLMLGKADLAQGIAIKCLEFRPDSHGAQRSMAIVLIEQGRTIEAKTILSKSIAKSPSEQGNHEQLCRVQMLLGKNKEAIRSLSSALELARNDPTVTDDVIVLQSQLQDLEKFDRLKFEILGLRTPATPAQAITVAIAAFYRGNYQRTLDLLESTVDEISDAELETPRMAYCYEIAAEAAARILLGQGHKFEAAIASKAPDGTPILNTDGNPRYALTMGTPLPLPALEFGKRPAMADLACSYLQVAVTIRDEGAQDVDDSHAIATHRAHLSRLPTNPGFSALLHPPSRSPWIESSQFVFDNIRQLLKDIGTL